MKYVIDLPEKYLTYTIKVFRGSEKVPLSIEEVHLCHNCKTCRQSSINWIWRDIKRKFWDWLL